MTTLVLIGGAGPDSPMDWALTDGRVVLASGAVGHDAPPRAQRAVLVVPGSDVHVRRLAIAARSDAQARAAAPFLFGGEVAQDTSALHFAIGQAEADGLHRLAAAIDPQRLSAWLTCCREAGFAVHSVYADFTVWPVKDGAVEIVELPGRTLVSAGALGGYAIEPTLAPALFQSWRERYAADAAARYCGENVAAWGALAATSPAQDNSALLEILVLAAARPPIYAADLMQGAFAARLPAGGSPLSVWRFAAALALIALGLHGGRLVWAGVQDRNAATQIIAQAAEDYRAIAPNADVRNLRVRVTADMRRAEALINQPVLAVTPHLIAALNAYPQARLDEIRHEAPARRVTLHLSAMQAADVEAAVTALEQAGLDAASQDISPRNGRFVARVEATP